jgi:threonine dehydrogenase-like Zn-dependent dehydrogenase
VRAIVFSGPGEFSLTEVPEPVSGPRDAVVRVEAVGICGTDVHVLDGEFAPTVFPIVPGHETSGVVVSVGEEVSNVAPGDPVSLDPSFYCGDCSYCMVGGTFQQFGVAPSDAQAKFSPFRIYNDELTVVGSMAVLHSYARAVDMFVAGALNAKAMVSHAYALADYGKAIEAFRAGTGRKVQIRPQARESMELL